MPNIKSRRLCRAAVAVFTAFLAGYVAPAAWAQAPSLAEVARKEQERRKTQKPAGKAYTNKDLPESAQNRGATSAGQAPSATPAPHDPHAPAPATAIDETKEAEKPAGDTKDEASWRRRISEARENVRRNEVFAEALQTRINSLSADFVARDDPYQRAKLGDDRDKTLAELARVKAEVALGKKNIEDIEEEARKAGVPPGWLR
jgi:hypothetical protein